MAEQITYDTRITDMPVLGDALIKIALSLHKKASVSISTQTDRPDQNYLSQNTFKLKRSNR